MIDSIEAVTVFLFFLPGIVGTLAYAGIAEIQEPTPLRVTATAIALSVLATVLTQSIFGIPVALSVVSEDGGREPSIQSLVDSYTGTDALIRSCVAIVLGLFLAVWQNKCWGYKIALSLHLTRRTGAIDPWHQVFRALSSKWLRVRYSDGKKLVGWARWHSEDGEKKELFLANATWHLASEENGQIVWEVVDVEGPGVLITSFDEVAGIDFLDGEAK